MTTAVDDVVSGIAVLTKIGKAEQTILPYATFIAGFFPGAASVLAAIQIAQPWIDKVLEAAPAVSAAVQAGGPIINAIAENGPDVMAHMKQILAIFNGKSPENISGMMALFAAGPLLMGRPWTQDEQARWFEKASGQQTNQW